MSIEHLVIHRIRRSAPTSQPELLLRDEETPVTESHTDLLRELKQAYYSSTAKLFGQFVLEPAPTAATPWFQAWRSEQQSFLTFSHKFMQSLEMSLQETELICENFVVFAEESLADSRQLYVFFLNHTDAMVFSSELDLATTHYLDIKKISLALKINLDDWEQNANRYISILRNRTDRDLTKMFCELVGFTETINSKQDTEAFMQVVESYTHAMPEEEAWECRNKVVDYCVEQSSLGDGVTIAEISQHMSEETPEAFEKFVAEQPEYSRQEIVPDKGHLKKLVRFSGRERGLSLNFSAELLGEAIDYDATTDTLIINKVPKSLKDQLIRHQAKAKSAAQQSKALYSEAAQAEEATTE